MEIINGKYKVLKDLRKENYKYNFFNTFIVSDYRDKKYYMNIIKDIADNKPLIDYIVNNINTIKGLEFPNLTKVIDFDIIRNYQAKENRMFFYIVEYEKYFYLLEDNTKKNKALNFSEEEFIYIYKQISNTLDYLKFNGIEYKFLNYSTINIHFNKRKDINFMDLISLKKYEIHREYNNKLDKEYLHKNSNIDEAKKTYDYYSFGNFLLSLATGKTYNPKLEIEEYIMSSSLNIEKNKLYVLIKLILNIINNNKFNYYKTIHEINKDIKKVFDINFEIETSKYINRLYFNIPLVGREREFGLVKKAINSSDYNLIKVTGSRGVGKTKFLNHLNYLEYIFGITVLDLNDVIGINKKMKINNCIDFILNEIESEYKIKNLREIEILKSEILLNKKQEIEAKNELKLIYIIGNILADYFKDQILIKIDDLDKQDNFFIVLIGLLNRLLKMNESKAKILISYNKEVNWLDLNEYYDIDKEPGIHLNLTELNLDEATELVQNIFMWERKSPIFTAKITSDIGGNPRKIINRIKEIYDNKLVYVGTSNYESEFSWKINNIKLDEFLSNISISINFIDKVKKLKKESLDILIFLSHIRNNIDQRFIEIYLKLQNNYNKENKLFIKSELKDFFEFNILELQNGKYLKFKNENEKKYIYISSQKQGINYHKDIIRVINIMIRRYDLKIDENIKIFSELAYQYKSQNDFKNTIKYNFLVAKNYYEKNNFTNALVKFKEIDDIINKFNYSNINILIKIAKVYEDQDKFIESRVYYKQALDKLNFENDRKKLRYKVNINNRLGYMFLEEGDYKKTELKITENIKISKKTKSNHMKLDTFILASHLYIDDLNLKNLNYYSRNSYDLAVKSKDNKKIGIVLNMIALSYILENKYSLAKDYLIKAIDIFEKNNLKPLLYRPFNNLGLIYDQEKDMKKAFKYYQKALEVSKIRNKSSEVNSVLNNIGVYYLNTMKYKEAINHFEEIVKNTLNIEISNSRFMAYSNIITAYIGLENYNMANIYLKKLSNEIIDKEKKDVKLYQYYSMKYVYYIKVGNLNKSTKYRELIYSNFSHFTDKRHISGIDSLFIDIEYYMLNKYNNPNFDTSKIYELIKVDLNGDNTIGVILFLYIIGLEESANKLYYKSRNQIPPSQLDETNRFIKDIITILLEEKSEKIKIKKFKVFLNNNYINNSIKIFLLREIAKSYNKLRNYEYAFNFILKAYSETIKGFKYIESKELEGYLKIDYKYKIINELLNYFINYSNIETGEKYSNIFRQIKEDRYLYYFDKEFLLGYLLSQKEFKNQHIKKNHRTLKNIENFNESKLMNRISNNYNENIVNFMKFTLNTLLSKGIFLLGSEFDLKFQYSLENNFQENNILDFIKNNKEDILYSLNINDYLIFDKEEFNIRDLNLEELVVIKFIRSNNLKDFNYMFIYTDSGINGVIKENIDRLIKSISLLKHFLDNKELKESIIIDKLTNVYTRKYVEDKIVQNINNYKDKFFSVAMIDIDNFKRVNDTYGHQVGDDVLRELGRVLLSSVRSIDFVARYGGEEFLILLNGANKKDTAVVLEKIKKNINNNIYSKKHIKITTSIGASNYPNDSVDKIGLIEKADQALYYIKNNGKNNIKLWDRGISFANNSSDALRGIVSENVVKNQMQLLLLLELIEITNNKVDKNILYSSLLKKISELIQGDIFILIKKTKNGHRILNCINNSKEDISSICKDDINEELLKLTLYKDQDICLIDWNNIDRIDVETNMPIWNSVISTRIENNGEVIGSIYISTLINKKEYNYDDLNLLKFISNIISSSLL